MRASRTRDSQPNQEMNAIAIVRPIAVELTRELRQSILRPTQTLAECEYEGDDAPASGHVGLFVGPQLLGVASIYRETREELAPEEVDPLAGWRLRGMAVVDAARGRGYGRHLLMRCEKHAQRNGGSFVWCNARVSASPFYLAHGYEIIGDEFDMPPLGLHVVMSKAL